MFSSIIRLGVAISGAAILSSCGGSGSVAETQQSTPEGLFTGTATVAVVDPTTNVTTTHTQNMLVFVVATGPYYAFYSGANTSAVLAGAAEGTLTFSGGAMASADTVDVNFQSGTVTSPSFTGGYNTGQNIAGTFTYPTSGTTATFNLTYNSGYQGVQNLATLAGNYTGRVGTSIGSEGATFVFSPASVPANGGNQFGVATVSGTGADGCIYTGTVSPLFKGNGYTTTITSGGAPCTLPNRSFSGLIYLDTANKLLYAFAPDDARTDGLIFTGTKL